MHQSHVNGNLPCDVVKMSQPIALLYNWEQLRGELQIGKNQDQRRTDRENALSSEVHLLLDAFFFRCVFRCVFLLTHNSEFPPCRNQGSGSKQKDVTDPLHPNSPTQHSGSTHFSVSLPWQLHYDTGNKSAYSTSLVGRSQSSLQWQTNALHVPSGQIEAWILSVLCLGSPGFLVVSQTSLKLTCSTVFKQDPQPFCAPVKLQINHEKRQAPAPQNRAKRCDAAAS